MHNTGEIAVAVIIFNRPDLMGGLFRQIRAYRPRRLYLIADGPRPDRAGEDSLCRYTRMSAEGEIDWRCEVSRCYSDRNMGCKLRIVSGLDYVFEREELAIILEDDTHPAPDFFPFVTSALEYFRSDNRVFSITGTNIMQFATRHRRKALLSKYTHIWGWATWRRSWLKYDADVDCLDDIDFRQKMAGVLGSRRHFEFWESLLRSVRDGHVDTWDYQLQAAAWNSGGFCLTPPVNLVSNVGFRADATHTTKGSVFARLRTSPLPLGLGYLASTGSETYDWWFQNVFHNPGWLILKVRALAMRAQGANTNDRRN